MTDITIKFKETLEAFLDVAEKHEAHIRNLPADKI